MPERDKLDLGMLFLSLFTCAMFFVLFLLSLTQSWIDITISVAILAGTIYMFVLLWRDCKPMAFGGLRDQIVRVIVNKLINSTSAKYKKDLHLQMGSFPTMLLVIKKAQLNNGIVDMKTIPGFLEPKKELNEEFSL